MRRLVVFARSPAAGPVKTRLSPALPARLAASLYAGLLADTFVAAARAAAEERFAFWTEEAGSAPAGFVERTQRGADLGERLRHAFEESLRGGTHRALVIGSDAPPLTAAHLDEAFAALETHDLVLGPTPDGGYWCIGLGRAEPALFHDIPWSTPGVLARTRERARAAGLSVATVASLPDLDTPRDLARLVGALASGSPACGARARDALCAMGLLPAAAP